MRIGLGSGPAEEDCASTLDADFAQQNRRECLAYIRAIKRVCGPPPDGAKFVIVANPHEFGEYLDVAIEADTSKPEAVAYAHRCEEESPTTWAEAGMTRPGRGRGR